MRDIPSPKAARATYYRLMRPAALRVLRSPCKQSLPPAERQVVLGFLRQLRDDGRPVPDPHMLAEDNEARGCSDFPAL